MSQKLVNNKAEKLVLIALFQRKDLLPELLSSLDEKLFGNASNKFIYKRALNLIGTGLDLPDIRIVAVDDAALNKEAKAVLQTISDADLENVEKYTKNDVVHLVRTLKKYFRIRNLYEVGTFIAEKINAQEVLDDKEIRTVYEEANALLAKADLVDLRGSTITIGRGGNVTDEFIKTRILKDNAQTLPTGFPSIDLRESGWKRGNLIVLTAPRGQYKSMVSKSFAWSHYYNCRQSSFVANLEMGDWEYLSRVLPENINVKSNTLRNGLDYEKNEDDQSILKKVLGGKRAIDGHGRAYDCRFTIRTVTDPRYRIEHLHKELMHQNYDVIVIDYLNLIAGHEAKDLWATLYQATKYAKLMAKDLNAVVYLLAQLNDEEKSKYSRSPEEDADVWLKWKKKQFDPWISFEMAKARGFEAFGFRLIFDDFRTRFLDPLSGEPNIAEKIKTIEERALKRKQDADAEAATWQEKGEAFAEKEKDKKIKGEKQKRQLVT